MPSKVVVMIVKLLLKKGATLAKVEVLFSIASCSVLSTETSFQQQVSERFWCGGDLSDAVNVM